MTDDDADGLGAMTAAAAIAEDEVAAIARVVGLPKAKVRRHLNAVHGKTLVRNVFESEWPDDQDTDDFDVDRVGDLTAAAAIAEDEASAVAEITGLRVGQVRRRLEEIHGKTLVRNVFEDEWPDGDEEDSDGAGTADTSDATDDDALGPSAVGEWLNKTRVTKGLSVPQLARRAGVSTATVYFIESGQSQSPRRETLDKLQRALGGSEIDPEARRAAQKDATIEGLGVLTDFDPFDSDNLPAGPGVYVFYDISQRPIYVGTSDKMRSRILDHKDKFWFRPPIVESGSYVEIADKSLRKQVETLLIKFLKSNAVLNKQNVNRE